MSWSLLLKFLNQDSTGMHDINLFLINCCVVSDQLVTCVAGRLGFSNTSDVHIPVLHGL